MKVNIQNKPLTYGEKSKFTEGERKVIWAYEKSTGLPFMRFDIIILKKIVQYGTPEQICSIIFKATKEGKKREIEGKENNFNNFWYLYKWVASTHLRTKLGGRKK